MHVCAKRIGYAATRLRTTPARKPWPCAQARYDHGYCCWAATRREVEDMANTYTQTYYHIVFSTKSRTPCIIKDRRDDPYRYIWGINKELKCHLYRIGGVDDHVHILMHLHPRIALATYVENVKTGSTNWVRRERVFTQWPGWQDGYGAFTISVREREIVSNYIKNQEAHHQQVSFLEEYKQLLKDAGIQFDSKYLV